MSPEERIKELEEALDMVMRFLNRPEMTRYSYLKGPNWTKDLNLAKYFLERVLRK